MSEILDINKYVIFDDSIESYQFVEQLPEAGEANINTAGTEINITFNNSSNCIHPSESYLRIEGQLIQQELVMLHMQLPPMDQQ